MTTLDRKAFKQFLRTMDAFQTALAAEGAGVPKVLADSHLRHPVDEAQQRLVAAKFLDDWVACLECVVRVLKPLAAKVVRCLQEVKHTLAAPPAGGSPGGTCGVPVGGPFDGSPGFADRAAPVLLLRKATQVAMCKFVRVVNTSDLAVLYGLMSGSAYFARGVAYFGFAALLHGVAIGAAAACEAPSAGRASTMSGVADPSDLFTEVFWRSARANTLHKRVNVLALAGFATTVARQIVYVVQMCTPVRASSGVMRKCNDRKGTPMYNPEVDDGEGEVCVDGDDEEDEKTIADDRGFKFLTYCMGSVCGSVMVALAGGAVGGPADKPADGPDQEMASDGLFWATSQLVTSGVLRSASMGRYLLRALDAVWTKQYSDLYLLGLPASGQRIILTDVAQLVDAASEYRTYVPCMARAHCLLVDEVGEDLDDL
jgi:hypothetical protein